MNPYIGITDFIDSSQVKAMLQILSTHSDPLRHMLHVGVMMSHKTLHGIPSSWTTVFPRKEQVASIFFSDEAYNCLHYVDYERDPELWKSLGSAIGWGGVGIDAVQLDMIWPDPGEIAHAVHSSRKRIEVILQIGSNALEEVGNDPQLLIARLREYEGVIHRILLDKSMGRGIGMNASLLEPFVRVVRAHFPRLGIGVAGGLGPETLHLVHPLLRSFPELSIDAQSRLRPSGNAHDPIDWAMAGNYLSRALELFRH